MRAAFASIKLFSFLKMVPEATGLCLLHRGCATLRGASGPLSGRNLARLGSPRTTTAHPSRGRTSEGCLSQPPLRDVGAGPGAGPRLLQGPVGEDLKGAYISARMPPYPAESAVSPRPRT